MPIENNLPIIFDTATQTEDGLMSYQDKIKLDNMDEAFSDKLGKSDKISSAQLDTSTDAVKIQPANLSDAVKKMMTGESSVEATVPNNGVTTEKITTNAITIDKIDKRVLLGNVVSPRPLNFTFYSANVRITIPQGTLFLTDATTKRVLVTGADTQDVEVSINYPTDYDGLNYIVSSPSGTLSMVNYRNVSTIVNTDSIMALVSLNKTTFRATIVMNGNYSINGLMQGIGTESPVLLSNGKIIFESVTGVIDFTDTTELYLNVGGNYSQTITSQASLRLADYSEDITYLLYWDNVTKSLKTAVSNVNNPDTDIYKIALIKDGRIIPFVPTGNFYSKPYLEAPYYTESFDCIENIGITSAVPIDISTVNETKIVIADETYVYLNQVEMKVENTECFYEDREGLHYILFDLDTHILSCRHYNTTVDNTKKNIVLGTMWIVNEQFPQVSGNFQFTVNGESVYENDLSTINKSIVNLEKEVFAKTDNSILSAPEMFMINGEEMPIYSSSMVVNTSGTKTAISYNKEGNEFAPVTTYFDGNVYINPDHVGSEIKLHAYGNNQDTSEYSMTVNKVDSNFKEGQTVKILCIGDSLINETAKYVNDKLSSLGVVPSMLGTMKDSTVSTEGRDGWFYSTFVGASGRGLEEGVINPQTSNGTSSKLLNPFVRVADANDKANRPNDCYSATGAYEEKSYYTDTNRNGVFYIFDFAKYLEVQGIENPDVVIIAIKPESASVFAENAVSVNMQYLKSFIAGIREALPDTYIGLIPQYGSSAKTSTIWEDTHKMIYETNLYIEKLNDTKVKVIPSWLHMGREFGTSANIEMANTITAFIMNI